MHINEILTNIAMGYGILVLTAMCFWTYYKLDRDDKKPKHKTKKA